MSHILIVGGTGMLKDVSLYFAKHAFTVSVIARNQNGLNNLIRLKSDTGFINPINVDYTNYNRLREKIISAIGSYGNIETCICWIHSTAPEAPYIIAETIDSYHLKCKYFQILGSEYANPYEESENLEKSFEKYKNIIYRKVILGFVIENNRSTWLTDREISNGVIDAVTYDNDTHIVGTVEPWERKP